MSEALAALLPWLGRELLAAGLVFLRVAGAVAVFPAFGEAAVPVRVRLALALGLTMAVAPAVAGGAGEIAAAQVADLPPLAGGAVALVLTETGIGLAFGLTVRLFVHALVTAGAMVAQATGLSQLFGAGGNEPSAAVAQLLHLAGLTLALSAGLHVQAAAALIWTYDAFPLGRVPAAGPVAEWYLGALAAGFALAFRIAVPFLIAGLVWNLALGAVNRAMPQLFATLAGAPATMLGALALMLLLLPAGLGLWAEALAAFLAAPDAAPP